MGTDSNSSGYQGKYKSKRGRVREVLSWGKVKATTTHKLITACSDNGGAVMFGATRDGGALSVTVLWGNDKAREYIGSYDEVDPVVDDLIEWLTGVKQ